jgi:tetratricopeptide (TPR) repeat protein
MVIGNIIAIPQNANAIRSGYYTMAFNNVENTVVMLAYCFWSDGKIKIGNNLRLEAIKLKQIATVDSKSKIAVYSIDDLDEAISGFNMAFSILLNKENAEAHYNLGHALLRKGDFDAAIQEFKKTVRINPNISDAHYNLGVIFFRKDDMDSAIDEFKEALRINPSDAIARKDLNLALSKKHAR